MGYRILYDNQILFDPYTDDRITDAKLSSKTNAASYFDFTMARTHSLYNTIAERAGEVRVCFDDLILFKGEITKIEDDFDGNHTVSCTGVLDFLGDTRVRPYSTIDGEQPLTAPTSVDGYFQWLIDQHNSNCLDSRKQFSVGVNQGNMLDKNNYIYRSSEQRPTTASEIEDKILNSLGGYLFVRFNGDQNILDLYADAHEANTQIIDFGVNITDFTKTTTTDDQYTAVVATGYTPDPPEGQTDVKMKPITLEGCPDGGTPYSSTIVKMGDRVYDVDAVARYGYREYYVSNTDIKTYDGLLEYSCKTLNTLLSPALSITVKAVDLALYTKNNYEHLQLGQAARVRSKPHNVDEYLMVNSIELDLNNPGNTEYELGASYDTLTGQQSAYLKSLNSSINSSLDTVAALGDDVKNSAKLAQEAKDTADAATEAAGESSSKADAATDVANSAINKAESATSKAEEAISSSADANTKADEANAKVTLVEKSATEAKTAADNAKKAADDATTAAGNAQTSADNANKAATDAKNAADSATTAASTAQSTADSALSSANKANEEVGNVKSQLTEINKEMTSVKQDAADLRDDLSGQITTVKETMEADYAKKSELSSTETNLKTEITKSAAGVMTEVSQTYSTKKELETTTKTAQTAQSTADAAKKAAESNASDLANAVTKFDGDISGLKDQIDGAIQTWFYDGIPDASTEPEVNWTTDKERQTHLGDLYYDNKTGFCYRYMNQNGVYSWGRIQDTEVTKALADAAAAQNTANAKKRIFVTTPTPPYDTGDLWVQGSSGDILRCQTAKISGQAYAAADWVKASKYTDDTAVTNLSNAVEKTYATKSSVTQLSDRIEQTVSSVEEVRTDASAAKTTAANAKKAADDAAAAASTAHDTASAAQEKANAAASAASTAQSAADTAKANATTAASAAATAKSAADTAQKAADAAKTTAAAAQKDADAANADLATAKKNLEAIQNQADATDAEVAAAKTAVDKAQKAADSANSTASAAASAAKTAQSTADTAKTNAANAQTKANQAATAASNAQSTADTAKTNAATAQTKANEAASAASTAQSTADTAKANAKKAQDDVDALKNRVTTAETKITQNSEQIALRATKTEVTSAVDNIKVGGRNLVVGSSNGGFSSATSFDKVTREYTKSTSGTTEVFIYTGILSDFQIGSQYTLSFWAKKDANVSSMEFFILPETFSTTGIVLNMNINATTEYKYFVYTFTVANVSSTKNTTVRFDNNGSKTSGTNATIYIKDVKLERGNKPTDWSPAPEDLEADATTKANQALADSKTYTDAQLKITSESITSSVSKTYTPKQYPDTRNTNQTPDWYFKNYPRQSITEFKSCSAIGLSGDTYCSLLTEVPWGDASGGYPKQTASVLNKRYWRVGTNGSTWGAWNDVTALATTASSNASTALSTANTANSNASAAKSTATTANNTANTVKSDLANNYTKTTDTLKTYYFGWGSGWTAGWIKLGTLTSNGDNSSVTIDVYSGNGYNGTANQNSEWEIFIKDGWQSTQSTNTAFGVTVNYGLYCDNVKVMVRATSHNVCDVWCYLPWSYPNGRYTIQGRYSKWEHKSSSSAPQSAEPTEGVLQSIVQETWTTVSNMQSSINQTAESIKSTVAATYVNNSTLSSYAQKSEITQVSNSLTARINSTQTTLDGVSKTTKNVDDYMKFESGPKLTIGTSSSSFKTVLTNSGESFMQGSQTVMELDGTTSTVKASRIRLGHYQWQDTGNSLQLVYIA